MLRWINSLQKHITVESILTLEFCLGGATFTNAAMAEWLRRLTRNQMGSSRVGSNPTRSETRMLVRKLKNKLLETINIVKRNK